MIDEYLAAIDRRAHAYPELPPDNFDPMTATSEDLEKCGLPKRPDKEAHPELFEFWQKFLGPPFKFVVPEFPVAETELFSSVLAHRNDFGLARQSHVPVVRTFRHTGSSLNWSGGLITPIRPNKFTTVTGQWNVTRPSVPSTLPIDANPQEDGFHSSTWIGINGHRRYPLASLPQIGTSQVVTLDDKGIPTVKIQAWWQWWSKPLKKENKPVPILNFNVEVGHTIMAQLTIQSADEVQLQIKNQTTGQFCSFLVIAPGPIMPLGTTAEWIMERPTKLESDLIYSLPRYEDVCFDYCLALSAPETTGPATLQKLDMNARLIRMYERFDNPYRKAFVSIPQKTSSTSLRISFREAGADWPKILAYGAQHLA